MGSPFISGVVEGFYGKPWNLDQRIDLFAGLQTLSLTSYMYAPRDETKHRLNWRELYTAEEAASLQLMINEAHKHDVTFIYALCPKSDIDYNEQDKTQIVAKLTQVRSLGCTAFALLFHEQFHAEDNGEWQAEAQVRLTNAVYEELDVKLFFLYPTVFTEQMAYPDLDRCVYLKKMGNALNSNIHIMWSGTNIVSRVISVEHCQAVRQILQRKPFIWDNFFINQYDRRLWGRLNLGPFTGRSVHLKDHIAGILLNPNNMYEANYIPYLTMSEWLGATTDLDHDASIEDIADEKILKVYDPSAALARAVESWLPEFVYNIQHTIGRVSSEVHSSADDPRTDPVSGETSISSSGVVSNHDDDDLVEAAHGPLTEAAVVELCRLAQERALDSWYTAFASNIVPSSFDAPIANEASNHCSALSSSSGATSDRAMDDPMQISAPRPLSAAAVEEMVRSAVTNEAGNPESKACPESLSRNAESAGLAAEVVPVETETIPTTDSTPVTRNTLEKSTAATDTLYREHLMLLVDLFFLPFEHGKTAVSLLGNYRWILHNAPLRDDDNCHEFATRVSDIKKTIDDYNNFFAWFTNCPRGFASEIFPLILEVHGLLSVVDGMVAWINQGNLFGTTDVYQKAWPTEGEYFKGELWEKANPVQGIIMDLAQTIANNQETSEFLYNVNLLPLSVVCFQIRPVQRDDAELLYHLMKKSHSQKWKEPHTEMSLKISKTYDRFFGMYNLNGFSKYAFLAEDTSTQTALCGVVGCMDLSDMHVRIFPAFVEETVQLYVGDDEISDETRTDIRVEVESWKPRGITSDVTEKYPSQVHIYAECDIADAMATKRLVQTIASSLSYNGSSGMHVIVDPSDSRKIAFLGTIGFSLLWASNEEAVFGLTLSTEDYFDDVELEA